MNRTIALSALAVAAVFLGATLWLTMRPSDEDRFAQCRSSTVAGDLGGPFELVNA